MNVNICALYCQMIKNKYEGKTIGEVFPDIVIPDTKFDDLILVRSGLGLPNGFVTFIYPITGDGLVYRKHIDDYQFQNQLVFLKDHIDHEDKI